MKLLGKVMVQMNRYLALHKIVKLGSFTRAAEALGYMQSALSQMIASLENELSIKLLVRSHTGRGSLWRGQSYISLWSA